MKPSTTLVKKVGWGVLVTLFWLLVWQIISMMIGMDILLPSPVQVIVELFGMIVGFEFWQMLFMTVMRVVVGFLSGFVLGTVFAIFAFRHRWFARFTSPIIYIVKSTPVASFIILALCWMGTETVPTFICLLMAMPIVWANVLAGLNAVDSKLLEMSDVFGFGFVKKLRYIYIPSILPYFTSAAETGLGLSWKAGIAAEVICRSKHSIGNKIFESKFYLEIAEMFALTAVVVLLSVVFDKLLKFASNKLTTRLGLGGRVL